MGGGEGCLCWWWSPWWWLFSLIPTHTPRPPQKKRAPPTNIAPKFGIIDTLRVPANLKPGHWVLGFVANYWYYWNDYVTSTVGVYICIHVFEIHAYMQADRHTPAHTIQGGGGIVRRPPRCGVLCWGLFVHTHNQAYHKHRLAQVWTACADVTIIA